MHKTVSAGGGSPVQLRIKTIRDRGQLSDVTDDIDANTALIEVKRNYSWGTKIEREMAIQIELNNASDLSSGEVEEITVYGEPIERIE